MNDTQKSLQVAFTGYHESQVKIAVKTIVKSSPHFGVVVQSTPRKENGLINYQPNLRGCDNNDLHVYSLAIAGSLANVRNLIKMKTPLGVQIDLLPNLK
ncbi:MAG: hypothetical protein CO032_00150 [Nitrosopumilales archaeon CG_4_9_14_0_2_um_filter_34_16]|nr:MAG: hypothetical protein CO032_00150 [Nitrosopumilales archaeon CG_4_9_14_0_2_um_filter_34_16]